MFKHWHAGMRHPITGEVRIFETGPEALVKYRWGGRLVDHWECDEDHLAELFPPQEEVDDAPLQ